MDTLGDNHKGETRPETTFQLFVLCHQKRTRPHLLVIRTTDLRKRFLDHGQLFLAQDRNLTVTDAVSEHDDSIRQLSVDFLVLPQPV